MNDELAARFLTDLHPLHLEEVRVRSTQLDRISRNMKKHYGLNLKVKREANKEECFSKALSKYLFPDMVSEIIRPMSFDYIDLNDREEICWAFNKKEVDKVIPKFADLLMGFYCREIPNFMCDYLDTTPFYPILIETENVENGMKLYLFSTPFPITLISFCCIRIDKPIIPLWCFYRKIHTFQAPDLDDIEKNATWKFRGGLCSKSDFR